MYKLKIICKDSLKLKVGFKFPDITKGKLQEKSIIPTKNLQIVEADKEYDGLSIVNVDPIPNEYVIPQGTITIKENGQHYIKEYENVIVNVNEIKTLQSKAIVPTQETQLIVPDTGYDGLSEVSVEAIPSNYLIPNGTLNVEKNGVYDVKKYENVIVDIETGGNETVNDTYAPPYVSFRDCPLTDMTPCLESLDTSNIETMENMFYDCGKVVELNLQNFNTSKVTTMRYMFRECKKATKIDVSSFNTSNVTNMNYMFGSCDIITSLDLSSFDMSKVTNVGNMFYGCMYLKHIDLRNAVFKASTYSGMFTNVPTDCLVIVKDDTAKTWITSKFTTLKNVKTVAEYEAGL